MAVYDEINVKIKGQVDGDMTHKPKDIVIAKLNLICAEYGLELEEIA